LNTDTKKYPRRGLFSAASPRFKEKRKQYIRNKKTKKDEYKQTPE